MRQLFAAIMVSAALIAPAQAATYLYSGTIDSYVTPYSGIYSFTVAGAQGGANGWMGGIGGGGAIISGDIFFSAGTALSILAGGGGTSMGGDGGSGGSGGGMSFIAEGLTPIIVAGGGGGAFWGSTGTGGPGLIGIDGGGTGAGTAGQGGTAFQSGAGWFSDGATALPPSTYYGTGGKSALSFAGGAGYLGNPAVNPGPGANGGFGGGGGGGYDCGGGGGGFSGGGQIGCNGGGGGSYISPDAFNVVATAGGNSGPVEVSRNYHFSGDANGYVSLLEITGMPVPEPSTWAMLIIGFFGIGCLLRRSVSPPLAS